MVSLQKSIHAGNSAEGEYLSRNEEKYAPICRIESYFSLHLYYYMNGLPLAFLRYPVPVDENIKIRPARHEVTIGGGAYKLNTMDAC